MFPIVHSPYQKVAPELEPIDTPTVLGINVPVSGMYGHNASAALVRGARILALCEQERVDRIKESGRFPLQAIEACLVAGGIRMKDIDAVALASDPFFVSSRTGVIPDDNHLSLIHRRLANHFGTVPSTIILVNHHLSHAASSFYPSGLNESLVITWDGGGDNQHTVIYSGDETGIRQLAEYPLSLGNLYNKFRQHLNLSDKGSLMGLASYGRKEAGPLSPFYKPENHFIHPGLQFARGGEHIIDTDVLKAIGPCRLPHQPITERHANLAANVQYALEAMCLNITHEALSLFPTRNLCLSGGVALNATFNGMLWRTGKFDEIFIQPNAPDGGLALGAALEAVHRITGKPPCGEKMVHAAYGPSYSREEIEETLTKCKIPWEFMEEDQLTAHIAAMLTEGKVIGWFQGRMEWGPRALGNRSILADPRGKEMADKVNNIIKYRDEWRPFALSILAERAEEYLENPCPDPFMITTSPVKKERQNRIPAVVHADGTTRPQFVSQDVLPRYHRLIEQFARKTGVPGILNTSFNLKGEPIVCSPRDALRTFYSSGIEVLVLGNHILRKVG